MQVHGTYKMVDAITRIHGLEAVRGVKWANLDTHHAV